MEFHQLVQLVQYLEEERRRDKAQIALLQERIEGLARELEARARQAQAVESAMNELRTQLVRALGWPASIEQLRNEFNQLIERIEEQRAKAERESARTRQIEHEALTRQLSELKREIKTLARHSEEIEARKSEEARLNDQLNRLQTQIIDVDRRYEPTLAQLAYLEEQNRQSAKRITAVEQELPDLRRAIEALTPQLLLLDEAVRRRQVELEEAARLLEAQNQLIENQRIADVRRERQFAEYAETIEKLKQRAEEIAQQVTGYLQMREEVKREIARLADFQERIEVRLNEFAELQREAERRAQRAIETFQAQIEKEWKAFAVEQDERWHERDQRISQFEGRLAEVEEELPIFQPQIDALFEILEALSQAYANTGREWLAQAGALFERARASRPDRVVLSRRQRRKQRAQTAQTQADAANAADLDADLVQ